MGWLDKYKDEDRKTIPQAPPTNSEEDKERLPYNPNQLAMMKARLAYASEFGNPTARRMAYRDPREYEFDNGEKGNVYVSSYDNLVTPHIQNVNNKLQFIDKPWSKENKQRSYEQSLRFDNEEDARYFGENYKEIAPMMKHYQNGGFLGTTNRGRNFSPAWEGAWENGGEMSYYQQGRDFQPKSISRNGSVVKDNLGYWNPDNFGKVVEIDSPYITMKNVDRELVGVSDTGDTKLLKPGKNYKFKGKKVREYPIGKYGINEVHELTDFSNKPNSWLNKYS